MKKKNKKKKEATRCNGNQLEEALIFLAFRSIMFENVELHDHITPKPILMPPRGNF